MAAAFVGYLEARGEAEMPDAILRFTFLPKRPQTRSLPPRTEPAPADSRRARHEALMCLPYRCACTRSRNPQAEGQKKQSDGAGGDKGGVPRWVVRLAFIMAIDLVAA